MGQWWRTVVFVFAAGCFPAVSCEPVPDPSEARCKQAACQDCAAAGAACALPSYDKYSSCDVHWRCIVDHQKCFCAQSCPTATSCTDCDSFSNRNGAECWTDIASEPIGHLFSSDSNPTVWQCYTRGELNPDLSATRDFAAPVDQSIALDLEPSD